jgi:hypothetical protein
VSRTKLITLALLLVFITQIGIETTSVAAISQENYQSLGWSSKYWWKSQQAACGDTNTSSTTLSGNSHAIKALNFLLGKGLKPSQAAGIVGNLMQETSGLNPLTTNTIGAHGIVQWYQGRRKALEDWAAANHRPESDPNKIEEDLATQLDYMWLELTTTYKARVLDPIKATSTIADSAKIVFDKYEVPGDTTLPKRIKNGEQVLKDAGVSLNSSGTPAPPAGTDPAAPAAASTCGSTTVGTGQYQNPFRDVQGKAHWRISRIDQGVDYHGVGPIHPLGNAKVLALKGAPSWGYIFIVYQLKDGPASGKYVYFSENCNPAVSIGQDVTPNDVLCNMFDGSMGIEIGWAQPPANGDIAMGRNEYKQRGDGFATNFGLNFNDLLKSLGTPPGVVQSGMGKSTLPLPPGWPKW